ncbi:decarboxylase [Thermoproteota archaeon]
MPKFVLSKSKVLEQYMKIEGVADIVSYSSKTNPLVSGILEANTDCMFSVHLVNELKNIKNRKRVMFLAQAWTCEDIENLILHGIDFFVVDNEQDLLILEEFLRNHDVKIKLLLRLKLKEMTLRTERYFVFGMNSDVVNKRIKELKQDFGDKIEMLGIHFHRKTQNMSEWNIKYELSNIIDENVLKMLDIVNIGGGLPSEYANTNVDVLKGIFSRIDEFKEWASGYGIKLMIEPGRFIAAPAGKLLTKVIGVYDGNVIVDASVYNSDMDAVIVPVKLKVEGELDKKTGDAYVIKGVTPCSMDLFRYRVYLKDPKVGDELVFLNAGAYNFSTEFCDLEKIETEMVD